MIFQVKMYEKTPRISSPVYYPRKSDKLNTSDNFTCTILAKRDYVVVIYNVTKHAAHKGLNIEKHTSIECSLMLNFSSLIVTELLIHLRNGAGGTKCTFQSSQISYQYCISL